MVGKYEWCLVLLRLIMLYSIKCFPLSVVRMWTAMYAVITANKCFLPDVKGAERNKWDSIWWDFRQASCMIIEQEFTQKQPYFVINILAYKEQIYKHSLILLIG